MLTVFTNTANLLFVLFHINYTEAALAKDKYVVANVLNYFAEKGEQGKVLGEFRKIEFARTARPQMRAEAQKRRFPYIGIFLKGEFVELL